MEVHLSIKKSQIPNGGNGVYTLQDIKQGDFIAVYQGKLIPLKRKTDTPLWRDIKIKGADLFTCDIDIPEDDLDYSVFCKFVNQETHFQEGFILCGDRTTPRALINDIVKFPESQMREEELKHLQTNGKIPVHPGFERNCLFQTDHMNRRLNIVATRDIKAGEELFIGYGWDYWWNRYVKRKII